MHYVDSLQSISNPSRFYIGQTIRWPEEEARLNEHNRGHTHVTSEGGPWQLVCCFAFQTSAQAKKFEIYLKSGSGRAFLKKHCQPT